MESMKWLRAYVKVSLQAVDLPHEPVDLVAYVGGHEILHSSASISIVSFHLPHFTNDGF